MARVHISYINREILDLKNRIAKEPADRPLTVEQMRDMLKIIDEIGQFVEQDCQNERAVNPGRFPRGF